jgi:hypothetical protein
VFPLPNGLGKYAVLDLSRRYAQDSPVDWNFNYRPAIVEARPGIF